MMMKKYLTLGLLIASVTFIAACSGKKKGNEPVPLPRIVSSVSVNQVWRASIGDINFPMVPKVTGSKIAVASGNGSVAMLDVQTGRVLWRASAKSSLTAGVGSNGDTTVVVTRNNEMVAFGAQGEEIWRRKIISQVLTPPLVSGGRVFLNATDRSVQAYDAKNGAGIWRQQQNIMDSLALRQDGVLDTYGNALIVGLTANLYAINPDTGVPYWGLPIGNPRGVNEIDRLADLVGGLARSDEFLCARSYQNAVACLRVGEQVLWSNKSQGDLGIAVDAHDIYTVENDGRDGRNVYTVESDGRILALNLYTGEKVWESLDFHYHQLTAPLVLGDRTLVVGDSKGNVHLLSRRDGAVIGRLSTNSSGVATTPIAADDALIIITKNGSIYGFKPN